MFWNGCLLQRSRLLSWELVNDLQIYVDLLTIIVILVVENKPVGSTSASAKDVSIFCHFISYSTLFIIFQADLLGDELSQVRDPTTNGETTVAQSSQDLLAEIFGNSLAPSTTSPPTSTTQKSSVNDILGLFDSPIPITASSLPQPSVSSAFSTSQPQPPSSVPVHAAQPRLTPYTAYDKNELMVTLTPQASATKPGLVNIIARFQVTGSQAASNLNFQAAVPRARVTSRLSVYLLTV